MSPNRSSPKQAILGTVWTKQFQATRFNGYFYKKLISDKENQKLLYLNLETFLSKTLILHLVHVS